MCEINKLEQLLLSVLIKMQEWIEEHLRLKVKRRVDYQYKYEGSQVNRKIYVPGAEAKIFSIIYKLNIWNRRVALNSTTVWFTLLNLYFFG